MQNVCRGWRVESQPSLGSLGLWLCPRPFLMQPQWDRAWPSAERSPARLPHATGQHAFVKLQQMSSSMLMHCCRLPSP